MIYEAALSATSEQTSLPVLKGLEGAKREWDLTLKEDPGESSAHIKLDKTWKVKFLCKSSPESHVIRINKDCAIIEPLAGKIRLQLGPDDLKYLGLWWSAIQLYDNEDILIEQFPCWLMTQQRLDSKSKIKQPTVADIRSFIYDRCPEDNRLLGATQFTDDQIMQAMSYPVDEWNSIPPGICYFTTVTFPWKTQWIKATAAYLLKSAAINQFRNNATYQAGTVNVNDSDKGQVYQQIGEALYKEWKDWAWAKKREINIQLGWGYAAYGEF